MNVFTAVDEILSDKCQCRILYHRGKRPLHLYPVNAKIKRNPVLPTVLSADGSRLSKLALFLIPPPEAGATRIADLHSCNMMESPSILLSEHGQRPPGCPTYTNLLKENSLKFLILSLLILILIFIFVATFPLTAVAAEKTSQKTDSQDKSETQTKIKLKYEKLNLDKEMRRALESLLPEGFQINKFYKWKNEYHFMIRATKGNNREQIASILTILDRLDNSEFSAFMNIYSMYLPGWCNPEQPEILLMISCRVKTDGEKDSNYKWTRKQFTGLFSDMVRELYMIKPEKAHLNDVGLYDDKKNFCFHFFFFRMNKKDAYANMGESNSLSKLSSSEYFKVLKLIPRADSYPSPDEPRQEGFYFAPQIYLPPYTPLERKKLINSIKETTPPNFNLKKIRFNRASEGFIIEISPQSKDKTAILKSIVAFLKEFSRLKGTEQLFFDRLIIHLSKDKTGVERMFIEMRQYPEVTPGGKDKPVYPGSKEYGEYRDSKIKDLESVVSKNPVDIFSDGYSHTDDTGKFSILTIQGE